MGLAAAGRVEGGAVEGDGAVARRSTTVRVELAQVGVAQVQQVGHLADSATRGAARSTPRRGAGRTCAVLVVSTAAGRRALNDSSSPPARHRHPPRSALPADHEAVPRRQPRRPAAPSARCCPDRRRRPALGPSMTPPSDMAVSEINDAGGVQRPARRARRPDEGADRRRRRRASTTAREAGQGGRHHRAGVVESATSR